MNKFLKFNFAYIKNKGKPVLKELKNVKMFEYWPNKYYTPEKKISLPKTKRFHRYLRRNPYLRYSKYPDLELKY